MLKEATGHAFTVEVDLVAAYKALLPAGDYLVYDHYYA